MNIRFVLKFLIIVFFLKFGISSAYSDNHNVLQILEALQQDIKTLERAVYSDSFENNDICMENIREQHIKEIGKHSCELITADGAIDNDHNPENTEENSACLLASEIKLAMHLQKEGGTFVVKVFGARLKITCELIAILCHLYKNVQIVKPLTSRSVNDERYIVCQEFQCDKIIDMPNITHGYLTHICDIDPYWFNELEKTVTTLANTQYTYLKKALSFDKNKHGKGKGYRGKGGRGIHKSRGRGYYTTSN